MSEQLSSAVNSWFFTLLSPKIYIRGLLKKYLFSKMCWIFSGHEFWVLKLFCSSKTDRVTIFFLFQLSKNSWVTLVSCNTYLWSFQLIFSCLIVDLGRSCRSLILFTLQSQKGMLKASYTKVCLILNIGISLDMSYEYLNFSVIQKLTVLQIFFFFNCLSIWAVFLLTRSLP